MQKNGFIIAGVIISFIVSSGSLLGFIFKLLREKKNLYRLKELIIANQPLDTYHALVKKILNKTELFFGKPQSFKPFNRILGISLLYTTLFFMIPYTLFNINQVNVYYLYPSFHYLGLRIFFILSILFFGAISSIYILKEENSFSLFFPSTQGKIVNFIAFSSKNTFFLKITRRIIVYFPINILEFFFHQKIESFTHKIAESILTDLFYARINEIIQEKKIGYTLEEVIKILGKEDNEKIFKGFRNVNRDSIYNIAKLKVKCIFLTSLLFHFIFISIIIFVIFITPIKILLFFTPHEINTFIVVTLFAIHCFSLTLIEICLFRDNFNFCYLILSFFLFFVFTLGNNSFLLIFCILPLSNCFFDLVSFELSRFFTKITLRLQNKWEILLIIFVDFFAGFIVLILVAIFIPFCIESFNFVLSFLGFFTSIKWEEFAIIAKKDPLGKGLNITLMLFSTLLPTFIHAIMASFSLILTPVWCKYILKYLDRYEHKDHIDYDRAIQKGKKEITDIELIVLSGWIVFNILLSIFCIILSIYIFLMLMNMLNISFSTLLYNFVMFFYS